MPVIIILAVIIGLIAWIIAAIFPLDFETVFLWSVMSVCGLALLFLLNPLFWQAYIRTRREERDRSKRRWEEWCELHKDELRRQEREETREKARAKADVIKNGRWWPVSIGSGYERISIEHGYQQISDTEFREKYEDINHLGW